VTEPTEGHTVRRYDGELSQLRLALLEMGGLVLDQVARSVQALTTPDDDLARRVRQRDDEVNRRHERLDEEALRLIAIRQPVANDLRVIAAIMRAASDLERIGDEAKKIALYSVAIHAAGAGAPLKHFYHDVRKMAALSQAMLRGSIDAFDRLDVAAAADVAVRDVELDREFDLALRDLVTFVMEDRRFLSHTINTVYVIKCLERIGDHAKNIAEGVAYLVRGVDLRHPGATQPGAVGSR